MQGKSEPVDCSGPKLEGEKQLPGCQGVEFGNSDLERLNTPRGCKAEKKSPPDCGNSPEGKEVNNVFTLKRLNGVWYLSGIAYATINEALTTAFSYR